MKKIVVFSVFVITSFLFTGCYTVLWNPDEDNSAEYKDYTYDEYYDSQYYGSYNEFYDNPWWITSSNYYPYGGGAYAPGNSGSSDSKGEREKNSTSSNLRDNDGGRQETSSRGSIELAPVSRNSDTKKSDSTTSGQQKSKQEDKRSNSSNTNNNSNNNNSNNSSTRSTNDNNTRNNDGGRGNTDRRR